MIETVIRPRAPFDFDATARFFRFSEAEIVDTFDAGVYARALHLGGRLYALTVAGRGTRSRPALAVSLRPARHASRETLAEAATVAREMLGTDDDPRRWRERAACDPLMSRLEAAHRGLRLVRWPTLFEALASSILLQQIATSVAWTFRRRFVERFGERMEVGGRTFHAFPLPSAIARAEPETLRALGLTNAKAESIVGAARAIDSGAMDTAALAREEDEAVVARLSSLRGVGRWTAEWVLMLHFGRRDVFAAADLFLRGVVAKYYLGGARASEREVRAVARERWGGWQSYASLYLLAGMRAGSITLKGGPVLSSN